MDGQTLIAVASIVVAGLTIAVGSIGPALAEGRYARIDSTELRSPGNDRLWHQ